MEMTEIEAIYDSLKADGLVFRKSFESLKNEAILDLKARIEKEGVIFKILRDLKEKFPNVQFRVKGLYDGGTCIYGRGGEITDAEIDEVIKKYDPSRNFDLLSIVE